MQIVLALGFLHQNNIAHRDLKPENVLIDADGFLAITDFGVSKVIKPRDNSKTLCGTLEYMAPEILDKTGHSPSVDWWSLGILTYEMVFGRTPYYTNRMIREELISGIQTQKVRFPNSKSHRISTDCLNFIQ